MSGTNTDLCLWFSRAPVPVLSRNSREIRIQIVNIMELFSTLIKKTLPDYLASLPIPDSFGGIFKLGCK